MRRYTQAELEAMSEDDLHQHCLALIGRYYTERDHSRDKELLSSEVCFGERVQAAYNVALGLNDMGATPEDAYKGVLVVITDELQERVLR